MQRKAGSLLDHRQGSSDAVRRFVERDRVSRPTDVLNQASTLSNLGASHPRSTIPGMAHQLARRLHYRQVTSVSRRGLTVLGEVVGE